MKLIKTMSNTWMRNGLLVFFDINTILNKFNTKIMKITIDDCYNKDVTIEEILEPTGSCLLIKQGENVIEVTTEYMLNMMLKSLDFMSNLHKRNND